MTRPMPCLKQRCSGQQNALSTLPVGKGCKVCLLVNIVHAEGLNAVLPEDALLTGINITKANVDQLLDAEEVIRLQPAKELLLLLARQAGDEADGHAVDVTAAAGLGGVDIGVGIDPDHGNLASEALPNGLGRAGNGANGNGVIATESEDEATLLGVRVHLLSNALGHVGDGARVLHVAVGRVLLGDKVRVEVHFVIAVQLVAELFAELAEEAGLDKGGGGGVDTRLALEVLVMSDKRLPNSMDARTTYLAAREAYGNNAEIFGVGKKLGLDGGRHAESLVGTCGRG